MSSLQSPIADEGRGVSRRPAGAIRRQFIPPQHGAWPMLAVPFLGGLIAAGYRWTDLPLAGAWFAGYLASYFVFQALKTRRLSRYRRQLLLYGGTAALLTAVVIVARPAVLWFAPAYGVLFAINAWYARQRQERALANDLAAVLQSCLIVPVVATVAGKPAATALPVFVLCLAYFAGTVFYVKTMIRERGNRTYRAWSAGYHLIALAAAAWVSPWAAGLFAWLLARAIVLPRLRWSPKRVGVVEIANCVALLAIAALL
jgi:YwiC-like protein